MAHRGTAQALLCRETAGKSRRGRRGGGSAEAADKGQAFSNLSERPLEEYEPDVVLLDLVRRYNESDERAQSGQDSSQVDDDTLGLR